MPQWNLRELRELVSSRHGDAQLALLRPHLDSVDWKIRIAAHHIHAHGQAFGQFFDAAAENERLTAIKLILSSGEVAGKFQYAKLVAEANAIACAQSVHSVAGILAFVIAYAHKINGFDQWNMSLSEIGKKLPQGALKGRITALLGTIEFRYLQDFVNVTKHVSLVFSHYSVDVQSDSDTSHGLKFKSFQYKDRRHSEKWSTDFLRELNELSIAYVEIGELLNDSVRGQPAA